MSTSNLKSLTTGGGKFPWKKNEFYGNIEDVLYAYPIQFDSNDDDRLFSHYLIMTKIGIGTMSNKKIEDVKFMIAFKNNDEIFPPIEIESISPSDKSKNVGVINIEKKSETSMEGKINGNAETDLITANLSISGHLKKGKRSFIVEKTSYPKELQIVLSNGVGTNAIWHFKQGDGIGQKGQYDLNIYFKLRNNSKSLSGITTYSSTIDISINNRNLNHSSAKPIYFID